MIKNIFIKAKRMSFFLITNTAYQLFNTEYIKKIILKFSHAFFSNNIAPAKHIDISYISPWKQMLWVPMKSASVRPF